jgi:hypothetical protein
MNSLLNADVVEPRKGFWERQIPSNPNVRQLVFDAVFGVVAPVICFYLDPGIIRYGPFYVFSYLHVGIFIYILSFFAIATLCFWLAFGRT